MNILCLTYIKSNMTNIVHICIYVKNKIQLFWLPPASFPPEKTHVPRRQKNTGIVTSPPLNLPTWIVQKVF